MAMLRAENNCAPDDVRPTTRQRKVAAEAIHRIMLRIPQARQAKLEAAAGEDGQFLPWRDEASRNRLEHDLRQRLLIKGLSQFAMCQRLILRNVVHEHVLNLAERRYGALLSNGDWEMAADDSIG